MIESDLVGVVLAGGQSSRMGEDKSALVHHGRSQLERCHELLAVYCGEVCVSGKKRHTQGKAYCWIEDVLNIKSPLNGIISAMRAFPGKAILTLPVDMPLVDESVISHLMLHREPSSMATCFYDSEGTQPEPLLTLWEPHCHEAMEAFAREGHVSPRDFLTRHHAHLVVPPDTSRLLNVNTREEWNRFIGDRK